MTIAVGYPPQSSAPSGIVAHVKSRIMSGATLSDSQVRIVVDPNPTLDPYMAEKHVSIRVSPPSPVPSSGAGRHGYKVSRVIQLYVYTESMLDTAGSDEVALQTHLDFEDVLLDIMIDERPVALNISGEKQGIRGFRFVPGNIEPKRAIKGDTSLLVSVLSFELIYTLRTRVNQESF